VLFGLLGGVSTMGVIGLFVGPFMMAVLFGWLRGGDHAASIHTPERAGAPDKTADV
jgi:predicted PurR-regulated permease PerM